MSYAWADDKKAAPRASNVVVETAESGMLAPATPFVGTAKFTEIAKPASESSGMIVQVFFEEGDRVQKGQRLAVIDSTLLDKTLQQNAAELEQIEANLEKAKRDFARTERLFKGNSISEQAYDDSKYSAIALEKQKSAKIAAIQHLKAQLDKKTIKAPFDGIIISKNIAKGDWVSPGSVVSEIAKSGSMDIVVNTPQKVIGFLSKDLTVDVNISGRSIKASMDAVIPKGDVSTRTFPVKLRMKEVEGIYEGMEAKLSLPSAKPVEVVFINRDAIVKAMGKVIVYTVVKGQAKPIPVQIVGYKGNTAGLKSEYLKAGMPLIIKGNERIQPDAPVRVIGN
jgi:RND family efflux transporter MFP subunit